MKSVVFFISLLVLSLSSYPCCDGEEDTANSVCTESHTQDEKDHSTDGPCSPFLSCGSCAGFALQYPSGFDCVIDEIQQASIRSYQHMLKSTYQYADFKPPEV